MSDNMEMMQRIMAALERTWMVIETLVDPEDGEHNAIECLVISEYMETTGGDPEAVANFRSLSCDVQLGLGLIVVEEHGIKPGRIIDVHRHDPIIF